VSYKGEHRVLEIHLARDDESNKAVKVFEYTDGKPVSQSEYATEENLPTIIRVPLAALKLITPPDDINQIGQRVNENVFWIYN
jgi:hypothetical protein